MSDISEIIPTKDTAFVENEGKNATKVEFDMAHNAAFIEEFNEKLKSANEADEAELRASFEQMTGMKFEDAQEAANTATKTEEKAQLEKPVEVVETEDEPDEVSEEILNQVDKYLADPTALKFTEEEIEGMAKIGVFDYETLQIMSTNINDDLDRMVAEKDDPDSPYFEEEARRQAIISTLQIKVSAMQAVEQSKEIMDPTFIEDVFNLRYPKYKTRGAAFIVEDFATYLKSRTSTEANMEFVVKEMNDFKKLQEILDKGNENIFNQLFLADGKPYQVGIFIKSVFNWNRSLLAEQIGVNEDTITLKSCESLILVFTALFVRWVYKFLAPEMKTRPMQRKLFQKFVYDNANIPMLSPEHVENLRAAWLDVINLCAKIAIKTNEPK